MKMNFHIIIFGCQMNYSDAARIKSVLVNCGFTYVETIDEADIVIFDTCSVRQKSEDKVTGKLKEIPRHKKIWITGCMIQHNLRNSKISTKLKDKSVSELMQRGNFIGTVQTTTPQIIGLHNDEMNEHLHDHKNHEGNVLFINNAYNPMFFNLHKTYPNIELFFRIDDTGFLPEILKKVSYDVNPDIEVTNEYTGIIPKATNQLQKEHTKTAFVPISTGCSQFCAFCIVPYARGLEKHLPKEKILQEVEHHLAHGIEEITLLGQIVNKHPEFVDICRAILKMPGLKRLRYTSPYPTYYSDELLQLHEQEEKLCPHIHMPLQSGSNTILKKMFRGYTAEEFMTFVDKIRGLQRPISITSDVIVGFCDETEEDFQHTLDLVQYAGFDMIYIGIYSTRPGTFAHRKYEDTVPKNIKQERRSRLNELLKTISKKNNQIEIGSKRDVLITSIDDEQIGGYTDNMKQVIVQRTDIPKDIALPKLGTFIQTEIHSAESFKLFGRYKT